MSDTSDYEYQSNFTVDVYSVNEYDESDPRHQSIVVIDELYKKHKLWTFYITQEGKWDDVRFNKYDVCEDEIRCKLKNLKYNETIVSFVVLIYDTSYNDNMDVDTDGMFEFVYENHRVIGFPQRSVYEFLHDKIISHDISKTKYNIKFQCITKSSNNNYQKMTYYKQPCRTFNLDRDLPKIDVQLSRQWPPPMSDENIINVLKTKFVRQNQHVAIEYLLMMSSRQAAVDYLLTDNDLVLKHVELRVIFLGKINNQPFRVGITNDFDLTRGLQKVFIKRLALSTRVEETNDILKKYDDFVTTCGLERNDDIKKYFISYLRFCETSHLELEVRINTALFNRFQHMFRSSSGRLNYSDFADYIVTNERHRIYEQIIPKVFDFTRHPQERFDPYIDCVTLDFCTKNTACVCSLGHTFEIPIEFKNVNRDFVCVYCMTSLRRLT